VHGGTVVELLEGPVCEGGIPWWRVRFGDNQEGWTAEGADGEYWIVYR
jgi:hypothetical protein